jgi:cobalt-zinc-cadmium efflux system protein
MTHTHNEEHHHQHDHGHHHGHNANKKVLLISFIAIFLYMIVEVVGGILTNSLALLSDAGHMLSDAAALGLSLFAFKLSEREPNTFKTYGYKRFEILAAFINGVALIIISLTIFWEAYRRFSEPPEVRSSMIFIAIIGLLVNILVAWILMKGDTSENINLRSALLHVFGDLLGSAGAIIAGLLIYLFHWNIADPIASVIVAILVLISGFRITMDSVHILMEGTPTNIELEKVKQSLLTIKGVKNIHDLHVWTITSSFQSLSCHLIVGQDDDRDVILKNTLNMLKDDFHIKHATVQIEGENYHHLEEDYCQ